MRNVKRNFNHKFVFEFETKRQYDAFRGFFLDGGGEDELHEAFAQDGLLANMGEVEPGLFRVSVDTEAMKEIDK